MAAKIDEPGAAGDLHQVMITCYANQKVIILFPSLEKQLLFITYWLMAS